MQLSIIYLTKKQKLDGFYFCAITWFLINPTYHGSIFIAIAYVHHTHVFSTRLSFQITLYANYFICYENTFLHFLRVRCYALVVLFANR